jgi:hypothetical protein
MRASKGAWLLRFAICLLLLISLLTGDLPRTPFVFVVTILAAPLFVFALIVFLVAIFTNRYNLILGSDGITFGSFYGMQHYEWHEIKAAGVVKPVSGTRVFIELSNASDSANPASSTYRYLPENYGMDPHELAKLLLRWKREHEPPTND